MVEYRKQRIGERYEEHSFTWQEDNLGQVPSFGRLQARRKLSRALAAQDGRLGGSGRLFYRHRDGKYGRNHALQGVFHEKRDADLYGLHGFARHTGSERGFLRQVGRKHRLSGRLLRLRRQRLVRR